MQAAFGAVAAYYLLRIGGCAIQGTMNGVNSIVETGRNISSEASQFVGTLDDQLITGRNPKALYSPENITEKDSNGQLWVNFANGRTNITYRTSEGGLYDILESDGRFNEPEIVKYTAPHGRAFSPKKEVGDSHNTVYVRADAIYRHATELLEQRLRVK